VLPEENDDAIAAFRQSTAGFSPICLGDVTDLAALRRCATSGGGLLISPRRTETDAFYASFLKREP
jgi:16S rRNA (cytosine967-C5)-methyltransferase